MPEDSDANGGDGDSSEHLIRVGPDGLHHWRVAAGIIERDGQLLLVENLRHNGDTDWSTPGGVVEEGEATVEALTREVREESGVEVRAWEGPRYTVVTTAVDMRWRLEVEVYEAAAWTGEPGCVDDPDKIVLRACFVDLAEVPARLAGTFPWVREPLLAYLSLRPDHDRRHCFELHGRHARDAVVTRVPATPAATSIGVDERHADERDADEGESEQRETEQREP